MDKTTAQHCRARMGRVKTIVVFLLLVLLGTAILLIRTRIARDDSAAPVAQIGKLPTDPPATQRPQAVVPSVDVDPPGDQAGAATSEEVPISDESSRPTPPVAPAGEEATAEPTAAPTPGAEPAEPTVASREAKPWDDAFHAAGDPPDALEICFEDFDPQQSVPQVVELERWFAKTPGQRSEIKKNRTQFGDTAWIEGVVRLRMPWREDVALRLSLWDCQTLQIHCFQETQGLTVAYHERDRHRWSAYKTTRKPAATTPESFTLAATDESRGRRTGFRRGGTLELRCSNGELVLSRGDVALLRAPMTSMPEEIYLEGKTAIIGIAAVHSGDFPPSPPTRPTVSNTDNLAELDWEQELSEGHEFERHEDGSVSLASERAAKSGWVATPIADCGLREIVLELADVTRGSGVYLAGEDGRPHEILRFVRERRSDRTCVSFQSGETSEVHLSPVPETVVPLVENRLWVRLVAGCGIHRCWISCDGQYWAYVQTVRSSSPPPITHLGLHCLRNTDDCRITLRRLMTRRFAAVESIGDAELAPQALSLPESPHIAAWLTTVTESQPAAADLDAWRRSCAVATLAAGCRRDLGNSLVQMLIDSAARRRLPLKRQLDLLAEAALLWDTDGDYHQAQGMPHQYHELGLRFFRSEDQRPFTSIRHALMSIPLPSSHDLKSEDERCLRVELLQLVYANRWRDVSDFCSKVRFFRQTAACQLVSWAEATAQRRTAIRTRAGATLPFQAEWEHPLIEEWNKDIYNLAANLDSLLDSEAYSDAARLVASIEPHASSGVTPSVSDGDLFVSLPTIIELAVRESPELRRAIDTEHSAAAVVRVRRAIRENDLPAVRMTTFQFAQLEAAAIAHHWLGDRALAAGWFQNALDHYDLAIESCAIADRAQIAARRQLAAALLGRRIDRAEVATVSLGTQQMAAPEFDVLIRDLLERNATRADAMVDQERVRGDLPQPTGFKPQPRGRFDGPVGDKPQGQHLSLARRFKLDWAGRQIATAIDHDTLYISNRFHVAAYDVQNGARRWQSEPPASEAAPMLEWGLIPMQPLLINEQVVTRLLYGKMPVLVCMERTNGRLQWTTELPNDDAFVSDPFILRDELAALTLSHNGHGGILRLAIISRRDGQVTRRHELARIADAWWQRRACQVASLSDGFVASMSGLVVAGDTFGNVRWMRRSTVLPSEEDPTWVKQHFDPPLAEENVLTIAQVGVRTVECLDRRSGRRIWSRLLPDVQQLVGVADGRLIVGTEQGLVALDASTGDPVWQHAAAGSIQQAWCDDATVWCVGQHVLQESPPRVTTGFTWLDTATGQVRSRTLLHGWDRQMPLFGPVVIAGQKLWALARTDEKGPHRDLLELTAEGEPSEIFSGLVQVDPWAKHIPDSLQITLGHRFTDWRLLSGQPVADGVFRALNLEANQGVATHADSGKPAVLARHTAIPEGGSPRLRLTLTNLPRDPCVVAVRFNREQLFREDVISRRTEQQPERTLEIDLSDVSGKSGWLIIEAQPAENRPSADVLWKQIDIVY